MNLVSKHCLITEGTELLKVNLLDIYIFSVALMLLMYVEMMKRIFRLAINFKIGQAQSAKREADLKLLTRLKTIIIH